MVRAVIVGAFALGLVACAAETPAPAADAPVAAAQEPAAAPESKFADNNGVKIHYTVSGSGPLVVAIHGFPDFSATWDRLVPALSDAYRVAAVDTRGYNLSDKPQGVEAYAMETLVADIAAVIAAEGAETATIIGHDWGAAIAWNYAFAHPDKLDRLVILSVPHPASFARELATNEQQRTNSEYARNFQREGSEASLSAEGLSGWVRDEAMKARYVEAFGRSDFAAMMNYYRANYPDGANALAAGAEAPTFPAIAAPVLIIHGMKDTALLASGHSGSWEHIAGDTTILMIPDAGHFVQHDAPELVNRTIRDWLDARAG